MPPPEKNNPWESADIPQPGILGVTEALNAIKKSRETLRLASQSITDETALLSLVAKSIGCEPDELKLGGPIEIAKGEKSILALGGNQDIAAGVLNQIPSGTFVSKQNLYARISCPSTTTTSEALVKWRAGLQGSSTNHLIISEGLAKLLGMDSEPNREIVIEAMYQKAEDINLDEL